MDMNRYDESAAIQQAIGLDDPITRDIAVERGIMIPMRDGVRLWADRWIPVAGGDGLPLALIRSPYKHLGGIEDMLAKPLAERGFQALIVSIRGREGSEGERIPFYSEREDGLDTIEWIKRQPWFGGSIIMLGPSYQGCVQWAIAGVQPPEVKMLIASESSTVMDKYFLDKTPYALEASVGWGLYMECQKALDPVAEWMQHYEDAEKAMSTLPIRDIDKKVYGQHLKIVSDLIDSNSGSFYGDDCTKLNIPMSIIGGWHDTFLSGQLDDFKKMLAAGCPVRLTIGEWCHYSPEMTTLPVYEAVKFGCPAATGAALSEAPRVKLYVMGAEEWREYESWPPEGGREKRMYLSLGGALDEKPVEESGELRYTYDPEDPTPAVGGRRMLQFPHVEGGRTRNNELEARSDVLVFTGAELAEDTEVIGEISAEVWFKSSLKYADVFVRLCDVDENGVSTNICDGITGLTNADEAQAVRIQLSPTAYVFKRGHRIRVQVSSGAFPEYARNMGTGEPVADAVKMLKAEQAVIFSPERISYIALPVLNTRSSTGKGDGK